MLGLSAACCSCSSVADSDELVLVELGRDDSLFASEGTSSAEPLTRVECLRARFVVGESFEGASEAFVNASVGSVMLTVGLVSIASGEFEASRWFAVDEDESGISLFRLAVLLELDIEFEGSIPVSYFLILLFFYSNFNFWSEARRGRNR